MDADHSAGALSDHQITILLLDSADHIPLRLVIVKLIGVLPTDFRTVVA